MNQRRTPESHAQHPVASQKGNPPGAGRHNTPVDHDAGIPYPGAYLAYSGRQVLRRASGVNPHLEGGLHEEPVNPPRLCRSGCSLQILGHDTKCLNYVSGSAYLLRVRGKGTPGTYETLGSSNSISSTATDSERAGRRHPIPSLSTGAACLGYRPSWSRWQATR